MKKNNFKLDPKKFILLVCLILIAFFLGALKDDLRQILVSPLTFFKAQTDTISPKQLAAMLKNKDFTLINVHTPYEGEIKNTDTFIPFDAIPSNSDSLPTDKNATIILYCRSGHMSQQALETIKKLGYTNVKHLGGGMEAWKKAGLDLLDLSSLQEQVLPTSGIELPVAWGDLGPKLVAAGVIDLEKFKKTVKMTPEQEEILTKGSTKNIKIDATNSQFIVDMLWALGLAQKSQVYDDGPLGKEYKDQQANFASTGGWTLAKGDAVNYLNKLDLIPLTKEQQTKVAEISQHVYRPCCGNSTWFPDCNHGMAALAIIELLVANNVPEATIYRKVLGFNSFWFGDSYLTVATYFARLGTSWDQVDAKVVLEKEFSSSQGASEIAKKVGPLPYRAKSAGGCGA